MMHRTVPLSGRCGLYAPWRHLLPVICLALGLSLSGCVTLAVSLAGAGAGAGISHQVNGVASRTFSEPLPRIRKAALVAARHMDFQLIPGQAEAKDEVLKGQMADLDVSVELENLSDAVTRVSVRARKNILVLDGATAQEFVTQIEHALERTGQAEPTVSQTRPARLENARTTKSRSKTKGSGAI
jgi:hypothetical protein